LPQISVTDSEIYFVIPVMFYLIRDKNQ